MSHSSSIYCLCQTSLRLLPAQIPLSSEHALREAGWAPPAHGGDGALLCTSAALAPGQGVPGAFEVRALCCAPRAPALSEPRCSEEPKARAANTPLLPRERGAEGCGEENGAAIPGGTAGPQLQGGRAAGRWGSGAGR